MAKVTEAKELPPVLKFNDITQAMMESYEEQYFDKLKVGEFTGAHRNAAGNIKAAEGAGWLAESVNGLGPLEYIRASNEIDAKYKEFTVISPSG